MRTTLLCLALAAAFAAPAFAAEPAAVSREVVGNRTSENVPPIPAGLMERLNRYQNTRGAVFGGWLEDGSMIISTRFAETAQVHRVKMPMGMREQLTFFTEPLASVSAAPAPGGNGFVYGKDKGGDEFWQLYWYDLDTRESTLLSDGQRSQNNSPLWSKDGRWLAWSGTGRNGADYDLYVRDMQTGQTRRVLEKGGLWSALDFSADGKKLLVAKYVSINEAYPGELDLATGEVEMFPVDGGKAAFGTFKYAPGGGVYFVSDENRQFLTLQKHVPGAGDPTAVSTVPWDVEDVELSPDGRRLAYVANEDGASKLRVIDTATGRELALPALPIGVMGGLGFSPDGGRLALTLNSATSPSDVYAIGLDDASLVRWTQSEVGGLDASKFVAPTLVRFPTFDRVDGAPRTIPAFYYKPAGDGPFPVVINIHGGPEAQSQPVFSAATQYLVRELGVAVLVPNVRGSSGYGKDYLQLDNATKREDSVRDIGALLDWIAKQPELDASRVGVQGGSYGGYMVLASMIHYNDRLKAGIDVVGISDFRTFLANTEDYRRDLRRAEYGDERDPVVGAYLDSIAPLRHAAKISRPLFVAQGFNDPRVPHTEAEQIVKAVRGNGGDVWFLMFDDEGHGFRKKANVDYFGAASVMFWEKYLLAE